MDDVRNLNLPTPPSWSLNVGSLGKAFVFAGIALFLLSALIWLFASKSPKAQRLGSWSFALGSLCLFGAFISLAALFIGNRFEFEYVFGHGDKRNAIAYRIAGVWSGQEGSFLLWGTTSAIFGLLAMRGLGVFKRWFLVVYSVFLGSIAGILAYESPFNLILIHGQPVAMPDGRGLAPSLQNYWVIIHPPTIFMGFGSLTVMFAFAIAAMASGKTKEWVPKVRPWAIVSMTLVGLGLCMGGLWAYETLGWGGFWAWDPVENTSFVPWALTVAFIHGLIVQANRGKWTITNLLFGGLPFLAFVYGTFLTRSGFLGDTSVHSFAEMDNKALWILGGVFVASVALFIGLWIRSIVLLRREPSVEPKEISVVHREGSYRWGAFFLICLALATGIGMSVPMIQGMLGQKPKVVEEWLYHLVVPWFFIPTIVLLAVVPFVSWGGIRFRDLAWRLYGPACLAFGLTGGTLLLLMNSPWSKLGPFEDKVTFPFGLQMAALPWVLILVGLCYFAAIANAWRILESMPRKKEALSILLSHVGVAIVMAGLIISRGLERKQQVLVQEGSPAVGLGYVMNVKGPTTNFEDRENKLLIEMKSPNGDKFDARPGLFYITDPEGNSNPMAWPHIQRTWNHDVYLTAHPMVFEATDAVSVPVGKTVRLEEFLVRYEKMTVEGEPGQVGTKFGAQLKVATPEGEFTVNPKLELTAGGMESIPALISDEYYISMKGMDAATKAVTLQLQFTRPVFPIELFYKPLTGLVWGGLGILTLGGFMAAWLRRTKPAAQLEDAPEGPEPTEPRKDRHALAPTS